MKHIRLFSLLMFQWFYSQSQVDTIWSSQYKGQGSFMDEASALLTDQAGNIYAAGTTTMDGVDVILIKYNSTGDTLWTDRIHSDLSGTDDFFTGLCEGDSGYIYVGVWSYFVPSSFMAFRVIKYSPDGIRIWHKQVNGISCSGNGKKTNRMAVDAQGNVFFTATKDFNFYTMKLSPAGDSLWAAEYGDPGYTYDDPSALSLDAAGNVFVTGKLWMNGSYDFCTIKYNSAGQQLWVKLFDGPGHNTDYPYAILNDDSGNCYVTGSTFINGAVNTDICTIKYDPYGDTLWIRYFDGSANLFDEAYILKKDNAGNIYTGGIAYGGSPSVGGTGNDFCVIKYNPGGNRTGIFLYNGRGNDEDKLYDFSIDDRLDIVLAGKSFVGNAEYHDVCFAKFSSSGILYWDKVIDGNSANADYANAITALDSGKILLAGCLNTYFYIALFHDVLTSTYNQYPDIKNLPAPEVFPNPFINDFTVRYYSPVKGNTEISLWSVYGEEIKKFSLGLREEGVHSVNIHDNILEKGLFFIRINIGNIICLQTKCSGI